MSSVRDTCFAHEPSRDNSRPTYLFLLLLCAAYSSLDGWADPLAGVSWRLIDSRDASPTVMGKFDAPRWIKPTSVPDQQLIYPLGGALILLLANAVSRGRFTYVTAIVIHDFK